MRRPRNIERYLNNERIRRRISRRCLRCLSVGTTDAGGLSAELRHRFNGIVELRAPILIHKLRFAHFKILCSCSAVSHETATQVKQTYILSDVLSTGVPINRWEVWCSAQLFSYRSKAKKGSCTTDGPKNDDREKRGRRCPIKMENEEEGEKQSRWEKRTPSRK